MFFRPPVCGGRKRRLEKAARKPLAQIKHRRFAGARSLDFVSCAAQNSFLSFILRRLLRLVAGWLPSLASFLPSFRHYRRRQRDALVAP